MRRRLKLTESCRAEGGPAIADAPVAREYRPIDPITHHHYVSLVFVYRYVLLVHARRNVYDEISAAGIGVIRCTGHGIADGRKVSAPILGHMHYVAQQHAVPIQRHPPIHPKGQHAWKVTSS